MGGVIISNRDTVVIRRFFRALDRRMRTNSMRGSLGLAHLRDEGTSTRVIRAM